MEVSCSDTMLPQPVDNASWPKANINSAPGTAGTARGSTPLIAFQLAESQHQNQPQAPPGDPQRPTPYHVYSSWPKATSSVGLPNDTTSIEKPTVHGQPERVIAIKNSTPVRQFQQHLWKDRRGARCVQAGIASVPVAAYRTGDNRSERRSIVRLVAGFDRRSSRRSR